MVTYHSTVPDSLALDMQLSSKLLGSVDTIICGLDLHWHFCTDYLPLKLDIGHDGLFRCELDLMMHTDIDIVHVKEIVPPFYTFGVILDLLFPKNLPGKP